MSGTAEHWAAVALRNWRSCSPKRRKRRLHGISREQKHPHATHTRQLQCPLTGRAGVAFPGCRGQKLEPAVDRS
jgi:hypothetical protein